MAAQETAKPAPGRSGKRARKADRLGGTISLSNTTGQANGQADKPLIDRHGHRHSEAVLTNWSRAALQALDVRWRDTGEPAVAADWPAPRTQAPQPEASGSDRRAGR